MQIDLILRGGLIRTMRGMETVDAIAIHQGRILAVGRDVETLTAKRDCDLQGRTVVPGFIDAHAHSVWFGLTLVELDVSGAKSVHEIYDLVRERAALLGEDEWVIGTGFNQMTVQNRYPDPRHLSEASGGKPVWLKHTSGHACIVDEVAMRIIEIDRYLATGVEGGRIVLDEQGNPTGLLEEQAMHLVQDVLLPYPLERIEEALEAATSHYVSEGLTSVTDAGVGGGWIGHSPQEFAAYQNLYDRGKLFTRQQVMPEASTLAHRGVRGTVGAFHGMSAGLRSGLGDERLQLGPVKMFLDGSILGATARMSDEYHHCAGSHGYFQGDRDSLYENALNAARAGWALAMHAVGDEAIDLAINIAEVLRSEGVTPPLPHRVEHGGVVRPEQVEQLAELGVPIVGQPHFLTLYGDGFREFIGDERAEMSFRSKSLLEAGMPLALSSDRPVAPGAPLTVMQSAMLRKTQSGYIYAERERLSVQESLHAYTKGAAAVTGWAGQKGVLAPGALADVVVLGEDPLRVSTAEVADIPVEATLVGGRVRFDPNGWVE